MKRIQNNLVTLGVGVLVALSLHSADATPILIGSTNHDGITNLTNDGTILKPWVSQINGGGVGQNATDLLDWLNEGGTHFTPGQITDYNSLTTSTLPQAGGLVFEDGSISSSGLNGTYMFAVGTYYVAAHWGGFNTAHQLVVTDPSQTYGLVADLNGTGTGNGGGGASVIRVWSGGTTNVPDAGATVALFGLALLSLGGLRHMIGSRKA